MLPGRNIEIGAETESKRALCIRDRIYRLKEGEMLVDPIGVDPVDGGLDAFDGWDDRRVRDTMLLLVLCGEGYVVKE
jgi:hypothetical protein